MNKLSENLLSLTKISCSTKNCLLNKQIIVEK